MGATARGDGTEAEAGGVNERLNELEAKVARLRLRCIIKTAEGAMGLANPDDRRKFIRESYVLRWLDGREPETADERAKLDEWVAETSGL